MTKEELKHIVYKQIQQSFVKKVYLLGSSYKGKGPCVWWTTLSVHIATPRKCKLQ